MNTADAQSDEMSKIQEAAAILEAIGLPKAQTNDRSALTLLALAGIGPDADWADSGQNTHRTVDIMAFIRDLYGKDYKPNSRETFRRQTLHQFMEARVVDLNPDDPTRPTNSGNNCYALTDHMLPILRTWGTVDFDEEVAAFIESVGRLRELYRKEREMHLVPVRLADGSELKLSPGKHNELQAAIIHDFGPRFAPGTTLLYLGDTAQKHLVFEAEIIKRLAIPITEHDKLPDVVLFDEQKDWIYFIEAVTSHGPVNPTRQRQLVDMLRDADVVPIYVSAFPDRDEFRKHVADIAWETEVWIASDPDHLIHFNGDKFLGPHPVD